MTVLQRPLPVADPDSAPFWEGCRAGELRAQRCASCGGWRWPPAGVCPHCRARGGIWTPLAGGGTVTSYAIVHRASHPAFAEAVPYAIVFVALDEAPDDLLLLSNLTACPPDRARVGLRVRVAFEPLADGGAIPLFRPEEA